MLFRRVSFSKPPHLAERPCAMTSLCSGTERRIAYPSSIESAGPCWSRCSIAPWNSLATSARLARGTAAPLTRRCGGTELDTRHPEESGRAIRRAIAIHDSLGETRSVAYLSMLNSLGGAYENQNRFREAVAVYGRAVALMDSIGRRDAFAGVILQHNTAGSLLMLGETAEAERLQHLVLEQAARADPAGRIPLIPLDYYLQAPAFNARVDSSLVYYRMLGERALEDGDTAYYARALFGLARTQLQRGDLASARQTADHFRRVSASRPTRMRSDEEILGGWIARAAGDTAASHAHFVEGAEARRLFRRYSRHSAAPDPRSRRRDGAVGGAAGQCDCLRARRSFDRHVRLARRVPERVRGGGAAPRRTCPPRAPRHGRGPCVARAREKRAPFGSGTGASANARGFRVAVGN